MILTNSRNQLPKAGESGPITQPRDGTVGRTRDRSLAVYNLLSLVSRAIRVAIRYGRTENSRCTMETLRSIVLHGVRASPPLVSNKVFILAGKGRVPVRLAFFLADLVRDLGLGEATCVPNTDHASVLVTDGNRSGEMALRCCGKANISRTALNAMTRMHAMALF